LIFDGWARGASPGIGRPRSTAGCPWERWQRGPRGEAMARDDDADEPYVIIEDRSSDVGPFLMGAIIGAGLALLLAPHTGRETRAAIGRQAKAARRAAGDAAGDVAGRVSETFADARDELERRIESARAAVTRRTQQLADAVAA